MNGLQVVMSNLWSEVTFSLDGLELTRWIVPEVREWDTEIGVKSPVGEILAFAKVGDEMVITVPDGNLVVKVLSIA